MEIKAADVMKLRKATNAGMMDCKHALQEAEGDFDKAVDIIRKKGLVVASKRADREAKEGCVLAKTDGKNAVMVSLNCETDFVGTNEDFRNLAASIADQILAVNPADVEALLDSEIDGKKVRDLVTEAVAKIGENISVRRFVRYESAEGKVYSYIHGGGKIGVLVEMIGADDELGKDIAMQVAAANPSYLDRTQVSQAEIDHEKEVLAVEARNEGKPEKIIEKMVIGRINKYYKEVCLVDQEFIKDGDLTISKLLKSKNASVVRFARYQLGEGIEKKQDDLAAEVAKQLNQ